MKTLFSAVLLFYLHSELFRTKAEYIRENGYCMWYGQCGVNPLTYQAVNCLYNGPSKPITESKSREILSQLCPELVVSNSNVCCDVNQVVSLQSGIQSAEEMMARCPGCWKNFRQLYCHLTCSPNNSMFIDPTTLSKDEKSIIAIDYYTSKLFRDGLYDSCKNVIFPASKKKIMNFMCGTTAAKCNALKFLRFMGDPQLNGVSPFLINYPVSVTMPGIKPMNATIKMCNETVFDPYTKSRSGPCSRKDCRPSGYRPIHREYLSAKIIFSLKPASRFNQRSCYQNYFSKDCVLTGTILRLDILQKILEVQTYLINMTVLTPSSNVISLDDFCVKPANLSNKNCIVSSVLQYWQNDAKRLRKCVTVWPGHPPCKTFTESDILASWGDHLAKCVDFPYAKSDTTPLKLSCISLYGGVVFPQHVLGGYNGENYTDASLLFVTFQVRKHLNEDEIVAAKSWENAFVKYLRNFRDDDVQLSYVPIDFGSVQVLD